MTTPNDKTMRLAAAQAETMLMLAGRPYRRIAYGSEGAGPTCCCCGAARGQLHVVGCLVERCPACRAEQVGFCGCSKGR